MAEHGKAKGKSTILNTQENRLKVLTYIAESEKDTRVEPAVSKEASLGYYYPEICKILRCEPGDELSLLESLGETGCIAGELFDKVDLCPYCLNSDLRLKRLCPYCRSSLIAKKEVLHHFRCGWVGIEDEAKSGTELVCPKCRKQMRHIGVDYERATESYYCTTCQKVFAQPLEEFLSIACGRQIPKDGTVIHPIFIYSITPIGMEVVRKQSFEGIPLQKGIMERDLDVYTREYIDRRLSELVNRFQRYEVGFSAALISIDQYDKWVADKGHLAASKLMKSVSAVLNGETRGVDLPGIYDECTFIVLLPQTGYKGAEIFAGRFAERIGGMKMPSLDRVPTLSIAVASCPEDGEDAEAIMSKLSERIERCRSKGGATIEGPKQRTA